MRAFRFLALLALALAGRGAQAATLTNLVNFDDTYGPQGPAAGLIADGEGNLIGAASSSEPNAGGAVFQTFASASGAAPTVLASFNGANGFSPSAGLIADAQGNLFGTTINGGAADNGVVFEILKTPGGYAGTATVLARFNGADGAKPAASLVADAGGNLFGTTYNGGASGNGVAFEIAKTASGYASAPTVLVSFNGANGANPTAGLIADASGNLFGTTSAGGVGGKGGDGVVFEILKTPNGYASAPTVLVNFDGANGANPFAPLIADASGNLFGTTSGGGADFNGAVFEIAKTPNGYASAPKILFSFNGENGSTPYGPVIADGDGALYGATIIGGPFNGGTVFKLTNTGFNANCGANRRWSFVANKCEPNPCPPGDGWVQDATGLHCYPLPKCPPACRYGCLIDNVPSGPIKFICKRQDGAVP